MSRTLSEDESKELLGSYGVPMVPSRVCSSPSEAASAAEEFGFPVAIKLCGDSIAHKTERGLVRLGVGNGSEAETAATELFSLAVPDDGEVGVLVAPMIQGNRELIVGIATDPQFGRTVMLGVGGILAEAIADVAIRLVPLTEQDANDMIDSLETEALLGEFRGEPAIDRQALVEALLALSQAAVARPDILTADCNPLIISGAKPVAVDALVEVAS